MSDNPNADATAVVGEAWTAGDPPTREDLEPGENSPEITNFGWSRMIRRMNSVKGIK